MCVCAGGVDVESDKVAAFLKEVEGKNVEELLTEGRGKLASMPAAGAAPAAGGGGGGAAAADAPKEEEKKEEESEEEVWFCPSYYQQRSISVHAQYTKCSLR